MARTLSRIFNRELSAALRQWLRTCEFDRHAVKSRASGASIVALSLKHHEFRAIAAGMRKWGSVVRYLRTEDAHRNEPEIKSLDVTDNNFVISLLIVKDKRKRI